MIREEFRTNKITNTLVFNKKTQLWVISVLQRKIKFSHNLLLNFEIGKYGPR